MMIFKGGLSSLNASSLLVYCAVVFYWFGSPSSFMGEEGSVVRFSGSPVDLNAQFERAIISAHTFCNRRANAGTTG